MIVVTAAAGQTGMAVVRALRHRGLAVRAVVGRDQPRPELTALGAEVAVADLRRPTSVGALLAGADALCLIWPNLDRGEAGGAQALLGAAEQAAVTRVVYHSVLRPQARSMPHHAAKDRVEEALDRSALCWRVLQPCAYGSNLDRQFTEAATSGFLRSPWGLEQAQSFVDLRDVAEAAAVLLTEDGLDGGTFEAAGPEPLTAVDVATRFTAALGREVTAVDAVPDGPVPPLDGTDTAYAAHCLRQMFDHYRAHGFRGSPRVLESLLGRPARRFAEHLADLPARAATPAAGGRR
jgi:uncharacterized protein YbjT (DUF2867 family)